jgi:hypothetical protein
VCSALKGLALPDDASSHAEAVRNRVTSIEHVKELDQFQKALECCRHVVPDVEKTVKDPTYVYEMLRSWTLAVMSCVAEKWQVGGRWISCLTSPASTLPGACDTAGCGP